MRALRVSLESSVVAVGVLLACLVTPAFADMCFHAAGVLIIAQGYSQPARGTCHPLLGNAGVNAISGTVCTNTAGTALRVGYTLHPGVGGPAEVGQLNLPLPSMTGGVTNYRSVNSDGTTTAFNGAAGSGSGAVCSPAAQPIP